MRLFKPSQCIRAFVIVTGACFGAPDTIPLGEPGFSPGPDKAELTEITVSGMPFARERITVPRKTPDVWNVQ